MLLMVDNYDSFTYNLVQYFGELGAEVEVHRNDQITLDQIRTLKPERIVLSPGPCTPNEAGVSLDVVHEMAGEYPILGVCLGHQAIGQAFGGKVVHASKIMHGKTSMIQHKDIGVFKGLSNPMEEMRPATTRWSLRKRHYQRCLRLLPGQKMQMAPWMR